MIITKDRLQNIVDKMPEEADVEEVFDKILIAAKIEIALAQINNGEYMTSEQLDEEIEKWD